MKFKIYEDPDGYHVRTHEDEYIFSTDTLDKANKIVELLEKDTAKDFTETVTYSNGREFINHKCNSCNYSIDIGNRHCKNCGQKI